MSDKILSFTQRSLAEALDNVRCLSDLGPELIAEQVFSTLAQQPAAVVPGIPAQWEQSLSHCWPEDADDRDGDWFIGAIDEDGNRYEVVRVEASQYDAAGESQKIAETIISLWSFAAAEQPAGTKSDKYRAELYDEVWEEARALGFGNVTEALSALARQQLDEKPDASAQLASIEAMCAMVEAREWADHVGVGEIGKRVESAISTLRNELQEAQRTAMDEHPDAVRVLHELPVDDIERRVASGHLRCTCPSGDGSLRWPCPAHPPSVSRT